MTEKSVSLKQLGQYSFVVPALASFLLSSGCIEYRDLTPEEDAFIGGEIIPEALMLTPFVYTLTEVSDQNTVYTVDGVTGAVAFQKEHDAHLTNFGALYDDGRIKVFIAPIEGEGKDRFAAFYNHDTIFSDGATIYVNEKVLTERTLGSEVVGHEPPHEDFYHELALEDALLSISEKYGLNGVYNTREGLDLVLKYKDPIYPNDYRNYTAWYFGVPDRISVVVAHYAPQIESGEMTPQELYDGLVAKYLTPSLEEWSQTRVETFMKNFPFLPAFGIEDAETLIPLVVESGFYDHVRSVYVEEINAFAEEYGIVGVIEG